LTASFENRNDSSEHYDRWLDGYLDGIAARYVPQPVEVARVLICSSRENRGAFLDPLLGWSGFFSGQIEVAPLEGDHFTVFRSAGLAAMAERIGGSLAQSANSPPVRSEVACQLAKNSAPASVV
jgi:hypothetical protein